MIELSINENKHGFDFGEPDKYVAALDEFMTLADKVYEEKKSIDRDRADYYKEELEISVQHMLDMVKKLKEM